jgi:hypothetical protein
MDSFESVRSLSEAAGAEWRSRSRARETLAAIGSVVADFIRERNLVVYGGQAIDSALRLAGHPGLYDDTALPDWDFYSPRHAADAYDLADLLAARFAPHRFRVFRALHLQTVRIRCDALSADTVADLSFLPAAVYDYLPVLVRDGLRSVHPHWQYADQHLALSAPFGRFPHENVFYRWPKDVVRHRLLFEHYPVPAAAPDTLDGAVSVAVPAAVAGPLYLLGGLAAVAAIVAAFPDLSWPESLRASKFSVSPAGPAYFVPPWHRDPNAPWDAPHADAVVDGFTAATAADRRTSSAIEFRAVMDVAPPAVFVESRGALLRVENSAGALVPFVSLSVSGGSVRTVCAQYVLKQLAFWAVSRREPRYWIYYAAVRQHCSCFAADSAAHTTAAPYWRLDAGLDASHLLGRATADPSDDFRERSLRSALENRPDPALATVPAPYAPSVVDGRVTSRPPTFVPAPPWFVLDGGAVPDKK